MVTSNVPVPDGSADYEVKATIRTYYYSMFVWRSAPRSTVSICAEAPTVETYYRVKLTNVPKSGSGQATLSVVKSLSGTTYSLGSTSVYVHNGMVLRAVIHGQELRVYMDGALRFLQTDSSISTGMPGFGGYYFPERSAISLGELGPIDRTAPSAIPVNDVSRTGTMTAVYLQWPAQTDGPDGVGLYSYVIYRDGQLLDRVAGTSYVDQAIETGHTYSYSISAEDFHGNASAPATFEVSIPTEALPPIEDGDGRRTGVRSTGSYWGAAGEQIDTHSGNLNFTLPLLTAVARGGMSVPFALSYNSQMWRKDAGGTWKLGRDVGYGFGWRLQAGSITPVYADGQLHHFVFTDSTGAVYRLSVCTDGHIWKSVESVFFEFDVTTGRLWFPNGSFWLMGSTSAGTEQDSGSRYPTLMQDSNGNQIVVRYYPGIGMADPNTSARIQEIEDIRATLIGADHYASYTFSYNTDTIPHLTAIQFRRASPSPSPSTTGRTSPWCPPFRRPPAMKMWIFFKTSRRWASDSSTVSSTTTVPAS